MVGVTALGGVSSHGRALLSSDDPLHHAPGTRWRRCCPSRSTTCCCRPTSPRWPPARSSRTWRRHLALTVADIESGAARPSTGSPRRPCVARSTRAGRPARCTTSWRASSRTPVPQALSYLVDDVSRRFGTIRVGAAESFLRSDDEAALAELVHHPRAAESLRLRRIAPTVVVSDVPLDVLLPRLRELGSAPVVEAPDGTVRLARRESLRARVTRRRSGPPGPRPAGPRDAQAAARLAARVASTVTAIRAGDRAAVGTGPRRRCAPPSRPRRPPPWRCCARRSRPAAASGSATSTTTAPPSSGSSTR